MLFTSIYRKKINAAEALIPLVAFNFKTYLFSQKYISSYHYPLRCQQSLAEYSL